MGKLFSYGFSRGEVPYKPYAMLCYVNWGKHGEAVFHRFSRGRCPTNPMLCYAM